MDTIQFGKQDRVDLGCASRETRGAALFDIDVSGGQLRYVTGMADE
jgi:hypothetical protein